jgi:hypothetical protein
MTERIIGINSTDTWLRWVGKGYLAEAATLGKFSFLTAFESALNDSPLNRRVQEWDAKRTAFKALEGKK